MEAIGGGVAHEDFRTLAAAEKVETFHYTKRSPTEQ